MVDVALAGPLSRKIRNSLLRQLLRHGDCLGDRLYLRSLWYLKFGTPLNLKTPRTFNEKLQWLKLNCRREDYCRLVDKLAVKDFVASVAGRQYVTPTIAAWDRAEDVDFGMLPRQFVLKCNHGSGNVVICPDKAALDTASAVSALSAQMSVDFSRIWREYPYHDVPRKVFAEELLGAGEPIYDYKFFCFDGKAHYIQVDIDRFGRHRRNVYTTSWELTDLEIEYPRDPSTEVPRPEVLDEMISLSEKLAAGIPHVRVDLYLIGNGIRFGEMTFFHGGGFEHFRPESWGLRFGDLLRLPAKTY